MNIQILNTLYNVQDSVYKEILTYVSCVFRVVKISKISGWGVGGVLNGPPYSLPSSRRLRIPKIGRWTRPRCSPLCPVRRKPRSFFETHLWSKKLTLLSKYRATTLVIVIDSHCAIALQSSSFVHPTTKPCKHGLVSHPWTARKVFAPSCFIINIAFPQTSPYRFTFLLP